MIENVLKSHLALQEANIVLMKSLLSFDKEAYQTSLRAYKEAFIAYEEAYAALSLLDIKKLAKVLNETY